LGVETDNTLRLGTDWHDADGIRSGGGSSQASYAEASGSGFLLFLGNFVEGPWHLSVSNKHLRVNGLEGATPRESTPSSGYEASREMEFLRQASRLADSLRNSSNDMISSTNILKQFCEQNSVGARISSRPGKVDIQLPSGVAVLLNLDPRPLGERKAQPHGLDPSKTALELMAKYLREGAGLIVKDLGVWTLIPRSRVPEVKKAIEIVKSGGNPDQAALKSLSSRDRALIRTPATLVRHTEGH
jgi:hypothetical protein